MDYDKEISALKSTIRFMHKEINNLYKDKEKIDTQIDKLNASLRDAERQLKFLHKQKDKNK